MVYKLVRKDFRVYMYMSRMMPKVIEFASRLCYDATDKASVDTWAPYISARIKSGHESVIEHGMISMIFDFTIGTKDFPSKKSLAELKDALCKSNSMLHYVEEFGWNHDNYDQPIVILSGNIRMWREWFKYLASGANRIDIHKNPVLDAIWTLFSIYDYKTEHVFFSDIPGMPVNNTIMEMNGVVSNGEYVTLHGNVDYSSMQPLYKDYPFQILYQQNMPPDGIANYDPGVTMKLVSVDNFVIDYVAVKAPEDAGYMTAFIHKHILDLYSVTVWVRTPRVVSQQEARHRINSISQVSQRYVKASKFDNEYYCPPTIDKTRVYDFGAYQLSYERLQQLCLEMYQKLLNEGVAKEDAREILPNSIYTEMIVTKPFYTLPHYFNERCSKNAQYEIRCPAIALRSFLNSRFGFTSPTGKVFEE